MTSQHNINFFSVIQSSVNKIWNAGFPSAQQTMVKTRNTLAWEHTGKHTTPSPGQVDGPRQERWWTNTEMLKGVQLSSVTQSCLTLCDPMNRSTSGPPVHHQHPEFTPTHAHRVGDALQPSHPLSSPSPPAPNPSQHQGLFQWVNSSNQVAKVLEFQLQHQSFSISSPSINEHPGLISFRMNWLDLLAVQGTLKSLLQHHSSKASFMTCQITLCIILNITHFRTLNPA